MVTQVKPDLRRVRVMWLAVGLALAAAFVYLLMAVNLIGVGDLQTAEKPAGIVYAAAAGYVVGGLLILVRRRWLWLLGLGINSLVVLAFVSFYLERPSVMFSPGGVLSKAAQILLEVCLLYLIVADWRSAGSRVLRSV